MTSIDTSRQTQLSVTRLVVTVLGPFALGYLMSYLYRSVNAVVAPNLVQDIGLSAGQLGLLTSAYLFAFALFQLPLGLLLDRFGPRRVQAAVFSVGAAGSLLFAIGDSALVLTLARAMIGLGFAGGLMAGFKAVVLWFPAERRALCNALIMSFGGLGQLAATVPVELAVQMIGWRAVFVVLAGITIAVALVILAVVPEKRSDLKVEPLGLQLAGLERVLRDKAFWRLAPLLAMAGGSHIAIQTLWAGPWFRDVAGLGRDGVAVHLSIVAVSFLVGILGGGILADWLGRRGVKILTVMSWTLGAYMLSLFLIILEPSAVMIPVWVLFGMTGQLAILAYPWLASYFGAELSGRATTAMNLIIFMTAFAVQYAVGAVIDLFPATATGGYDPRAYQVAFGVVLGILVVAMIWYLSKVPRLPDDRVA